MVIDIHHHILGKDMPNAAAYPAWNIETDLLSNKAMDIEGCLLSLPVSGKPETAHAINTMLAKLSSCHPEHYGMLACLPGSYCEEAKKEIDYACDVLHADGFILPTNAEGIYIGDDRMDPILEELDNRKATVLIHPTKPANADSSLFVKDMSIYEFPFDTTRAVIDFIYRGKRRKYPNIRWIISHAGGTLPYLAYRLSVIAAENKVTGLKPAEILDDLRSFYFDLALSTTPAVFDMLKKTVGADRLIFGSDMPLRTAKYVAPTLDVIKGYKGFTAFEKRLISSENAKKLFPRFCNYSS